MGRLRTLWNRIPAVDPSVFLLSGVGLMGAAASFLLFGQIENHQHPSRTLWYVLAVVFLVGGALAAMWGAVEAIRQWRENAASLDLAHDPTDPRCRQIREGQSDVQLRVRVSNAGRVGLQRVRATLDREGGYGHWLRIEHDNSPPYQRSLDGEVLPALAARAVYFDVAFMGAGGQMTLQYADAYLLADSLANPPVTGQEVEWIVTIRAEGARESDGRAVAEVQRRFRIVGRQWDGGNERSLEMVAL